MHNTSQIATTLPNDQKQALEQWCAKQDRSMSRYIRRAVQEQMKRDGIVKEGK